MRTHGNTLEAWLGRDASPYGWYSNKMRGQRDKQAAEEAQAAAGTAVEVIDVSAHKSRRIPSAKWRELIKKVWEAAPLLCPRCLHEMRIVSLIDDRAVIELVYHDCGPGAPQVQESEFATGLHVVVNYGDEPYPLPDGRTVGAHAALVEE